MKASFFAVLGISAALFAFLLYVLIHGAHFPLLAPAGAIGIAERDLMMRAVYLMLIVVVPVYLIAIYIGWHFREDNKKATYTPDWEHSKMEELIWWSIPLEVVLVLGALTWGAAHDLAPEKPLAAPADTYRVEVVALPWKWLFIYPDEGVASVNELAIPAGKPVEFTITADAPMNSFWIPDLGGQMYAMTGMATKLHLTADKPGEYQGRSANYSGEGFAQMTFTTKALGPDEFRAWVARAHTSSDVLSSETYGALALPSEAGPVRYYGNVVFGFADVMAKYMTMEHSTMSEHHH